MRHLTRPLGRITCVLLLSLPIFAVETDPATAQATAEDPRRVLLQFGGGEGDSIRYRLESESEIRLPEEAGADQSSASSMVLRHVIERTAGDTIHTRVTIEDIAVDLDGVEELDAGTRALMEEQQKQMRGSSIRLVTTRTGEVLEMMFGGGLAAGAQGMEQAFRETGVSLPAEEIAVGDSWSEEGSVSMASFGVPLAGEMRSTSEYTLAELREEEGSLVAVVRGEVNMDFVDPTEQASEVELEMIGSGAEVFLFDVDRGQLLTDDSTMDITVNVSVPSAGESMTMQMIQRTRMAVVED